MVLRYKAPAANTGALTFNDGLGAVAVVGAAHAALQGGETAVNGDVWLQWNSSIGGGSYMLIDSTGGAVQVAPATQSQHAVQYGQMLAGGYTVTNSVTYTNGLVLPNNVGYQVKTTGGVSTPIAFIDATNNANFGNNTIPTVIAGSAIQTAQPLTVPAATAAGHAVRYDQSFGVGQTLTNVLPSRAIGTTYTNSTGKAITVNVAASAGGAGSAIGIFVSGMGEAAASIATAAAQALAINAIVPAGGTYVVQQSGTASTLASWYELR
jgi:hypothetical protein